MHLNTHHRIATTEDALNNHIERTWSTNISHILSSAIIIGMNRVEDRYRIYAWAPCMDAHVPRLIEFLLSLNTQSTRNRDQSYQPLGSQQILLELHDSFD